MVFNTYIIGENKINNGNSLTDNINEEKKIIQRYESYLWRDCDNLALYWQHQ